jgi:hypothetical protein
MKPKIYRQGDVLILRVSDIPKEAVAAKRDKGQIILAYGEVTGHSHAIHDKAVKSFLCGDDLYLALDTECEVTHQEHGLIRLPAGKYKVAHQVEYRRKEIVRVAD